MKQLLASLIIGVMILFGCKEKSHFNHFISSDKKPWTHSDFDTQNEKFTFAIFSDLTGGERKGVFEVAVAQLNLLRPDMIINVGDLIEGDHENLDELNEQWDSFDERANKAKAPIFYVGGNHDLTNPEMWDVWDKRYGKRYYHFIYKSVLFLLLNTEDNTPERTQEIFDIRAKAVEIYKAEGLEAFSKTEYARLSERVAGNISEEQSNYFQDVIANNSDVRWTFVFIHKPAWAKENEKNFAAIESALAERDYTLFYGHVQAFNYEQRNGRDYIRLATTGGEQFPSKGRSMDQLALVTVDDEGISIANLLMEGILDKTGNIPLGGDTLCFEKAVCEDNL